MRESQPKEAALDIPFMGRGGRLSVCACVFAFVFLITMIHFPAAGICL